jgi:uncharacterized protein
MLVSPDFSKLTTPADCATDFATIVAALRTPNAYQELTLSVEAVETHMSWVFKTDRHAFKLKKPLRSEYFDHTSIEARRRNSHTELALNRRFAADVYLAVLPVTRHRDDGIRVDGRGEVVDWLVKMRRLEAERMLDQCILQGTWSVHDLRTVTQQLANYYASAHRIAIAPADYIERLDKQIDNASLALDPPRPGISPAMVRTVLNKLRATLHREQSALALRVAERGLVDGHGDLRPEHVCLGQFPAIIDCIEFDTELRQLDPIDDLGFLALECERLGAMKAGDIVLATYRTMTADDFPRPLLHFYQALRAIVRAKLAAQHLDEERFRDSEKWRNRTIEYLYLASRRLQ